MSSQPPKAGVPFPQALAAQLGAKTTEALTIDAPAERWIVILEAAAFSPVRTMVRPTAPSSEVSADLTKTVMRLAPLMPQVAALYGVQVEPGAPMPKPLRAPRPDKNAKSPRKGRPGAPADARQSAGRNRNQDRKPRPADAVATEPTNPETNNPEPANPETTHLENPDSGE